MKNSNLKRALESFYGIILGGILCCFLCACHYKTENAFSTIYLDLTNSVPVKIREIEFQWMIRGEVLEVSRVEPETGDEDLRLQMYPMSFTYADGTSEEMMQELVVKAVIQDANDEIWYTEDYPLPSMFGDHYVFELCYEDGDYRLEQKNK